MSSLRLESLRLVWLEAFLKVTEAENISAAARDMGVDQSTVSRHLIALQKWLGKDLIDLGAVNDDEEPRRNVGLTDAGVGLLDIAEKLVPKLIAFRTEAARREEVLEGMERMVAKMMADLNHKRPSVTVQSVQERVVVQAETLAELRQGATLEMVEGFYAPLRRFFATYEDQLKKELRAGRRTKGLGSANRIDLSASRKGLPKL